MLQSESLIYHELVPGHHFQIASQSENDKLHPLRKNFYPTAFTEGWAMYSSFLGRELGQYQDLYDLYGHLSMEMMISVRLVVDTGMNHLKWPRSRAMELMLKHTLHSDTEIGTESLRYSADIPAQALAYKMGEIKILELREEARKRLGDKFDIRRFHQAVLGSGALPMTVLERVIYFNARREGIAEADVARRTRIVGERKRHDLRFADVDLRGREALGDIRRTRQFKSPKSAVQIKRRID